MNAIFENDYDLVLTNPPFGKSCMFGIHDINEESQEQIFPYTGKKKMPSKIDAELFMTVAAIRNSDITTMLLPEGMLSTSAYETFRKLILQEHGLHCSISYPSDIFHGATNVKCSMLMFERNLQMKPDSKIMMAIVEKDKEESTFQEEINHLNDRFKQHLEEEGE